MHSRWFGARPVLDCPPKNRIENVFTGQKKSLIVNWREISLDGGESLEGKVGRICFYRLLEDEDLLVGIQERMNRSGIKAGFFMAIGALKSAAFGLYQAGEYKNIRVNGPLELASCMGNVAIDEKGETVIHAHVVVSDEKGEAFGGHLMKNCIVNPTAELTVVETLDVNLVRAYDKNTKLNLLKLT